MGIDQRRERSNGMRQEKRELIGGIWLKRSERKLLELAGKGFSNREIADRMALSASTVKNYFSELLGKLGVKNKTHAVAWFLEAIGKNKDGDASEPEDEDDEDEKATADMSPSEMVEFATERARRIYQVSVLGNHQKAFEMVEELSAWVKKVSKRAPALSKRLRKRLGRMLLRRK